LPDFDSFSVEKMDKEVSEAWARVSAASLTPPGYSNPKIKVPNSILRFEALRKWIPKYAKEIGKSPSGGVFGSHWKWTYEHGETIRRILIAGRKLVRLQKDVAELEDLGKKTSKTRKMPLRKQLDEKVEELGELRETNEETVASQAEQAADLHEARQRLAKQN
jgi:hypothetical protein